MFALQDGLKFVNVKYVLEACPAVLSHRILLKFDSPYFLKNIPPIVQTIGTQIVRPIPGFSSQETYLAAKSSFTPAANEEHHANEDNNDTDNDNDGNDDDVLLPPSNFSPAPSLSSVYRLAQKKRFLELYCKRFASLPY